MKKFATQKMTYTIEELRAGVLSGLTELQASLSSSGIRIKTEYGRLEFFISRDMDGYCDCTRISGFFRADGMDNTQRVILGTKFINPQYPLQTAAEHCVSFIREQVNYCSASYEKAVKIYTESDALTRELLKILM